MAYGRKWKLGPSKLKYITKMNLADTAELVINIVSIAVIPFSVYVVKSLQSLKVETVRMQGEINQNAEEVKHQENAYRQGISHLNDRVERMDDNMMEIKTDIKELLKFTWKQERE